MAELSPVGGGCTLGLVLCTLAQGAPSNCGEVDPVHFRYSLSHGYTLISTPGPHSTFPCHCIPLYVLTCSDRYTLKNVLKKIEKVSKKNNSYPLSLQRISPEPCKKHLLLLQFTFRVQCT